MSLGTVPAEHCSNASAYLSITADHVLPFMSVTSLLQSCTQGYLFYKSGSVPLILHIATPVDTFLFPLC